MKCPFDSCSIVSPELTDPSDYICQILRGYFAVDEGIFPSRKPGLRGTP